jgi:hypothetical protein
MDNTRSTRLLHAALLASTMWAVPHLAHAQGDAPADRDGALQLATGQYITPVAMAGAVQQPLNPGLAGYPNFVAGEAVRSQLSPDGTTLAIICAGQNSLYMPSNTGTIDAANST